MQPYTYLIGWSKHQKFYYGVRYSASCTPNDLWVTYFTSSNRVKKFTQQYGQPDIIQIRKTFNSGAQARLFEEKILRRLNCAGRSDFLNASNGKAIPVELSRHVGKDHPLFGKGHTEKTKQKMRKPKTALAKHSMSAAAKERWNGVDRSGINNHHFKGFVKTPFGMFPSLKEAALAEPKTVHLTTIRNRINNVHNVNYERIEV